MAYWSASLTLAEGERPVQLSPGSGLFPWVSRRQDSTWLFAEGRCWRHEGGGGSCQSWVPQIWDREEEKKTWEKIPEDSPIRAENWALALPRESSKSVGRGHKPQCPWLGSGWVSKVCYGHRAEYSLAMKRIEDAVTLGFPK